ncbi:MAG: HAMP domain-containing sensor histidine kinase [Eubacteriales bacterium]|nr:HAMP domain-containing sensor histidine kinase [Eubacteriales bacterium]
MKGKLSLHWRITLSMGALVLIASLLLTALSIWNVSRQFVFPLTEIYDNEVSRNPTHSDKELVLVTSINETSQDVIFKEEVDIDPLQARKIFSWFSLLCTVVVTAVSMITAYFLARRAMKPISRLSQEMEQISGNDLCSRVSVPETDDEIAQLSQAFNGLLERLEQEMEREKRFSADAAHELKTPLTTMITNAQVLKLEDCPTMEEYKENLEITLQSAKRLSKAVNDLLALHGAGRELDMTVINLEKMFRDIWIELEPVYREKKQTFQYDFSVKELVGDKQLLYRALFNLVENACKYTPQCGSIKILSFIEDGHTVLKISDNGIGISDDDIQHIFEPFYRVDKSRSRNIAGSGLGMSITKEIFSLHHAEVSVNSVPKHGTEIRIIFDIDHDIKK